MAGTLTHEGHIGLTSRGTTPLPAGTGDAPVDTSGNCIAGEGAERTSEEAESGCSSQTDEFDNARIRVDGEKPRLAENAGEVPISEESLEIALYWLDRVVLIKYGDSGAPPVPTIYRVPLELTKHGGRRDYSPLVVLIGGFHSRYERRNDCNRKLEEYKWCCVRQLIAQNRCCLEEPDKTRELLRACLTRMNHVLPRVRDSYSPAHDIQANDSELAQMMLCDGCLILHRLLKYARTEREDDNWTLVFGNYFVWRSVTRDLLLLQNQIPFFVVKELFQVLKNKGESEELLFTGSLRLFRSLGLQMQNLSPEERNNVHHLLHLFYLSVGCPQQSDPLPYRNKEPGVFLPELTQWVPRAKELEEAGVRIRKRRNTTSFLDITFDYRCGVLEIPPLQLDDSSSALFRNMIAFEQAYPATRCDVSTYAVFMDSISTPEDMRILHLRGILVNQMNGEQNAGSFFSQICAQVHFPADNYLVGFMEQVRTYKDSRWHNWRAALVRNYFGNPWLAMSVIAAVLLLALTVLQTFFTVYPYYKPSE